VARRRTTNPAREYFDRLVWDKKPRLEKWLTYFLGAEAQPPEYIAAVGKKWMTAIVSRAFRPGAKFDHMLILEGSQGTGKSTALRELATFGGETFFYDGKVSFTDKDTLIALQGKIIIEMAEMASYKKAINEEIKAFISRQSDDYRPAYGRYVTDRPRYFVLTGSTNEKEYLIPDESGHRRYWPVECGKIDIPALQDQREQLWAEAVALYKTGFPTWVLPEEVAMFTEQQEKRVMRDAWSDLIEKYLQATMGDLSIDDIFAHLEVKPVNRGNIERTRVKSVLRQCGWYETRALGGRVWRRKTDIDAFGITKYEGV
jgi:putative DNA primase/helicase